MDRIDRDRKRRAVTRHTGAPEKDSYRTGQRGLVQAVFVRCNGRQAWSQKGKVSMFLYTVLFVVSLTVAIAIPLIYHLFKRAGIRVYETMLPGSNSGSLSHIKATLQQKRQQKMPIVSAVEQTEAMIEGLLLVREDKLVEVGEAYKVTRRTSARILPKSSMPSKAQDTTIGPNAHGWYG
jgi:hypothetical protein